MTELLAGAALLVGAAGVLVAGLVLAATRRRDPALPVLLDFLTAAGLLRLAGDPGWSAIGTAAAVVAIRKLATWSLTSGRPEAARWGA